MDFMQCSKTIPKVNGHKAWLAEVQFLGVVNHPNLVKLPGYCSINGERGINGYWYMNICLIEALENHLFNRALNPLPWITRLQIMLGAAQGLAYLHEELEVQLFGNPQGLIECSKALDQIR
ncbi:hypothetical protein ABKV19_012948 [Rosa sericea]